MLVLDTFMIYLIIYILIQMVYQQMVLLLDLIFILELEKITNIEILYLFIYKYTKKLTVNTVSLERVVGIEPTPSAWKAEVLPLNYTRVYVVDILYIYNKVMERVVGIEPTPSAWKAEVLPLNYTRISLPDKYKL